jgi:nicotinamide-nucleotide amidase
VSAPADPASALVARLTARKLTLAVAESLTGGLVVARVVDVPGASVVLRGGIIAYATELKQQLLGVDAGLLAERGAVDPDVALAMARGVRERLSADVGVATTGVAGPDPQDGRPAGTAFVAVCVAPPGGEVGERVVALHLPGDRAGVRAAATAAALDLVLSALSDSADGGVARRNTDGNPGVFPT